MNNPNSVLVKVTLLAFIFFVSISCTPKKSKKELSYFDFDKVEYYYKNISENEIYKLYAKIENQTQTPDEKEYLRIVESEYPEDITNTVFISNLDKYNYKKKVLDKSKNAELNKLFSENTCEELTASACVPVYRDIFIFKKNDKIVGIAKICYDCHLVHIVGTKKNWDSFGECGNFEKLKQISK